jgi:hypothetical protein
MMPIPLNILQKLMRRWDAVHPYNAAQVMKLTGTADAAIWQQAWDATMGHTGLGPLQLSDRHYQFLEPKQASGGVRFPDLPLDEHLTAEMNRPFDEPTEPPFRPFIITSEGNFHAGVVYQHWLADSTSIRRLMREWFVRVYDPAAASCRPIPIARAGYWQTIGPNRAGWEVSTGLLDMTRRHIRLRRVQKIASTALSDHATRFQLIPTLPGLIDQVRAAARRRKVKVNDLFLAALVEACSRHVPLQRRRQRTDVAVGSVVDLRPWCPAAMSKDFGIFLGFTNVICQPAEIRHFDRLLQCVATQTRLQKSTGVAPASLVWMTAALYVGLLSKPDELYHFYRKELPLAGGISNVDLTRDWPATYHPTPLLDYIRISPTGPMTPLVVTTTTLGSQFHLGVTHRTGLISPELALSLASSFLARLQSL